MAEYTQTGRLVFNSHLSASPRFDQLHEQSGQGGEHRGIEKIHLARAGFKPRLRVQIQKEIR